ncbi:hypothetical protein [Alicyclobacillus herbarius]|uniref:hypothetical protein n=1 Tax=Alicyclobacillus herbarius TaxID=122960 RepID=UPI000409C658|nr:hypothetical protein [Alicyclobacillus herbarius]
MTDQADRLRDLMQQHDRHRHLDRQQPSLHRFVCVDGPGVNVSRSFTGAFIPAVRRLVQEWSVSVPQLEWVEEDEGLPLLNPSPSVGDALDDAVVCIRPEIDERLLLFWLRNWRPWAVANQRWLVVQASSGLLSARWAAHRLQSCIQNEWDGFTRVLGYLFGTPGMSLFQASVEQMARNYVRFAASVDPKSCQGE